MISQASWSEERIVDDALVKLGIFAPAVLPRVVDEELALGDARRAEGIGLDDVGARFQEAAMDVADHLGLREREEITIVEEILFRVREARASDVRLLHPIGADRGAHGAVDDRDAAAEELLEGMDVRS